MDNQVRLGEAGGSDCRLLILALDRALATVPLSLKDLKSREAVVRAILDKLAALGVDGENLLRYGMAPRAALPLLVKLVGSESDPAVDLESWRSVLSIPSALLDSDVDAATDAVVAAIHNVDAWVVAAPLTSILTLTPPAPDVLRGYVLDNQNRAALSLPYVWLWLRSTQDELDRWPTEALHLEYRWRNGYEKAPFPASALEDQGPATIKLNEEIALRAAVAPDADQPADDTLFWQLQDTAVSFLARERYQEASALFEFHSRHHPEDPRSLNNLGFCKLPVDPALSLDLLKRAESAGYSPLLINVYNQCCCLIRLNRLGEALDRAEYFWQRESDPDQIRGGYIWIERTSGWDLIAHDMIDEALARLMAETASSLGQGDRASRWSARADEIAGTSNPTTTSLRQRSTNR